jgi:hypothetical protein
MHVITAKLCRINVTTRSHIGSARACRCVSNLPYGTEVRDMVVKVQRATQDTVDYVFSSIGFQGEFRDAQALLW